MLRAVWSAGRLLRALLEETLRVTGCGVATTAGGALALPPEPTVVQAPMGAVGTAGTALLANSAYLLPAAAETGLAAFCAFAATWAATARCLRFSSSFWI